jgi:protocatechuate 4,5-dioxygenase alpha chain
MDKVHDYDDIPGTTVFDAQRSRKGYHLNMFCMSLMKPENREAFKADPEAYLQKFPMTDEQRRAVLDRDWNEMIYLGGNIYFTSKIAACDGLTFQNVAAAMTGMTNDEYLQMMIKGGRSVEGNRSLAEWRRG